MRKQTLTEDEQSFALHVLLQVAPEEQTLFTELLKPQPSALFRPRNGAIGFGVQEVVDVVSPTLFVLGPWAWSVLMSEVAERTDERMKTLVRRAFGAKKRAVLPDPKSASGLSEADLRILVTDIAHERLGLSAKKSLKLARVLAAEIKIAEGKRKS